MRPRFLADTNLRRAIVAASLRRVPDIDFQMPDHLAIETLGDPSVLALAAAEGRILVSQDVTTLPAWFRQFIGQQASPGLVLIPQHAAVSQAADALVALWGAANPGELQNRIHLLPSMSAISF